MLSSVLNFRDVGGYKNREGKEIRKGLLFRSGQLNNLSESDIHILKKLDIKNCIDLRGEYERKKFPQKIPENIKYHIFDVLFDAKDLIDPVFLEKMARTPDEANSLLGGGKIEELFKKVYRHLITLKSAQKGFSSLFNLIIDENNLPLMFL